MGALIKKRMKLKTHMVFNAYATGMNFFPVDIELTVTYETELWVIRQLQGCEMSI